jgi:DNA-binding NarL/FixJ family response regulator
MERQVIRVAIVEDDPEIRRLLQLIIGGSPGFSCGDVFSDGETALKELPGLRPDVVLMDIGLPGISGIQCVQALRDQGVSLNIIMLSVRDEDEAIFDSLCAGASGYLVKETPPVQLLEAIRECYEGGAPMSAAIARRVVASFRKPVSSSSLSEREMEVLGMLCAGENYKGIAEKLFVSGNTVKAHIKHIYAKLQVHTRAEAVSRAYLDGLV